MHPALSLPVPRVYLHYSPCISAGPSFNSGSRLLCLVQAKESERLDKTTAQAKAKEVGALGTAGITGRTYEGFDVQVA